MPDLDLERRLHGVDHARMPDLLPAARERAASDGPLPSGLEASRARRAAAAVTALAVAAAAFGVLVWTFRHTRSAAPGGPPENGPIATVGRGPDSIPGVDNTDLVAIDPVTGARWNLTNSPDAESDPSWSADGTHVAFIRTTTTDGGATFSSGVFAMDVATGETSEVYPCEGERCDIRSMTWSPDDRSLAIVDTTERPGNGSLRFTSSARLVVVDPADERRAILCADGPCALGLGTVAWSPDGTRIAFAGFPFVLTGPVGPEPSSVWVADADGSGLRRITEGDACRARDDPCFSDQSVAWSPDGSRIAFRRESAAFQLGGPSPPPPEIVVVSPDESGVHAVPVCDGAADVGLCQPDAPIWSADGTHIITAIDYHPRSVVSVDVSTGRATTLASSGGGPCDLEGATVSWSPDHRSITYEGGPRGGNVCAIPAAGGDPRVVLRDFSPGDPYAGFTWLPAGALSASPATPSSAPTSPIPAAGLPVGTLVFASTGAAAPGSEGPGIWSESSAEPTARLVTDGVSYAREPSLSPDGTRVVFAGIINGRPQVWSVGLDGSGLTMLTDYRWGAGDPAWSPDGSTIAFTVEFGKGQTQGLYVMNADGTGERLLWEGQAFGPAWSPDGTGITFAGQDGADDVLETVDVATGEIRRVLPTPGGSSPAWSPDGSTIAFWWNTVAGAGLYLADADGSHLRRVPGAALDGDGRIAWSPDGRWLAFQGFESGSDAQIFVVRPEGTDLSRVTNLDAGPETTGPDGGPRRVGDPSWGPTAS